MYRDWPSQYKTSRYIFKRSFQEPLKTLEVTNNDVVKNLMNIHYLILFIYQNQFNYFVMVISTTEARFDLTFK